MSRREEELVASVASRIRELYLIRRQIHARVMRDSAVLGNETYLSEKWDGGRDRRGVQHKPIWPRLAAIALEKGIEPQNWVEALFANAFAFDHVPWPSDLTNAGVMRDAIRWAVQTAESAACVTRTELLNMNKSIWLLQTFSNLSIDEIRRAIVADPRTDVSPLVRYVFAVENGYLDLAAGFEAAALTQYSVAKQAYKDVLGDRLPRRLVELSEGQ